MGRGGEKEGERNIHQTGSAWQPGDEKGARVSATLAALQSVTNRQSR